MVASAADVARSREGVPPIIQWAVCGRSDGVIASWEMVLFAAEADDAERMWYLGVVVVVFKTMTQKSWF